jgi:hypothetical protein
MAYINTEDVARIRGALKVTFPNLKFGVRKSPGGHAVTVVIKEGDVDFDDIFKHEHLIGRSHAQINQYHLGMYGQHEPLLSKIVDIIKTAPSKQWYDRSNAMVDYFDTAFYFNLSVGEYEAPYKLKELA